MTSDPATRLPPSRLFRPAMHALTLLGAVLPWIYNLRYFAGGGSIAPGVFWADASANALTTAITADVYLAAIAFAAWVLHERNVRWPWAYVALCFGVGLACALPWYLAQRMGVSRDPLSPAAEVPR